MSFNFKEALGKLNGSKTIEELSDDFLQLIILNFQSKNIKKEDIDTIYFVLELTGKSLPLRYKVKAVYTLKREGYLRKPKYHLISSFGDYKYVEAANFAQTIKETFKSNGINYKDDYAIDTFESNYREPFSIKC